jgi:hypothetical protein
MIDTRTVGELQQQVLTAARQGRQRLAMTVKNLHAAARLIKPQLPALPRPNLSADKLSGQVRQIRGLGPVIAARLPKPEQVRSSAQELAGTLIAAQRALADQALATAKPLARQAAARLARNDSLPQRAASEHASTNAVHRDTANQAHEHAAPAAPASASAAKRGRPRSTTKPAGKPAAKRAAKPAAK